jgi:hypothetical protein
MPTQLRATSEVASQHAVLFELADSDAAATARVLCAQPGRPHTGPIMTRAQFEFCFGGDAGAAYRAKADIAIIGASPVVYIEDPSDERMPAVTALLHGWRPPAPRDPVAAAAAAAAHDDVMYMSIVINQYGVLFELLDSEMAARVRLECADEHDPGKVYSGPVLTREQLMACFDGDARAAEAHSLRRKLVTIVNPADERMPGLRSMTYGWQAPVSDATVNSILGVLASDPDAAPLRTPCGRVISEIVNQHGALFMLADSAAAVRARAGFHPAGRPFFGPVMTLDQLMFCFDYDSGAADSYMRVNMVKTIKDPADTRTPIDSRAPPECDEPDFGRVELAPDTDACRAYTLISVLSPQELSDREARIAARAAAGPRACARCVARGAACKHRTSGSPRWMDFRATGAGPSPGPASESEPEAEPAAEPAADATPPAPAARVVSVGDPPATELNWLTGKTQQTDVAEWRKHTTIAHTKVPPADADLLAIVADGACLRLALLDVYPDEPPTHMENHATGRYEVTNVAAWRRDKKDAMDRANGTPARLVRLTREREYLLSRYTHAYADSISCEVELSEHIDRLSCQIRACMTSISIHFLEPTARIAAREAACAGAGAGAGAAETGSR